MGLFRYIVQGFGWEIGAQAAREGIAELRRSDTAEAQSPRQAARLAKKQAKEQARARKRRDAEVARKRAEIEAQLAALKKRAGH
jgi:hypothetical protein